MQTALFIYCGILTISIVATIHHYEDKLKKSEHSNYLNSNQLHYTYLQLENKKLKEEIIKLTPLQYEHKNEFGEK